MPKMTLQAHQSILCKKKGQKKQLIFEELDDFENWQLPFAKCSVQDKNKIAKNDFTSKLELFCSNDGSKKQVIFEKRNDFKNW